MTLGALTEAALLGTARREPPAVELPEELTGGDLAPERRILRDAALLAVMHTAGELPAEVAELPDPAPDEHRPTCPPAAAAHLRAILTGPYGDALDEWLDALARSGAVVPPEAIRQLLDRATADQALARRLDPLLPERGRWLAAQHDAWEWAVGGDPVWRWETGTRAARLHALRTLRTADPGAARELLAATWAQEPARDREALLAEFEIGLGPDDEPFLEACLADRGQGVRAQACALLSALPRSALSARMRERLERLVGTRLRTLTVELPETTDEDGLSLRRPSGVGERAWTLWQIVAATPLDVWERVDADPAGLLRRRVADGMGDLLRSAWAEAAARQHERRWAAALLERGAGDETLMRRLIPLAPAAGERRLTSLLKDAHGPAAALATALPRPWSRAFSAAIAAHVPEDPYPARWGRLLAAYGDPGLADGLADAVDPHLRDAAALLAFRRTMLETLEETRPA